MHSSEWPWHSASHNYYHATRHSITCPREARTASRPSFKTISSTCIVGSFERLKFCRFSITLHLWVPPAVFLSQNVLAPINIPQLPVLSSVLRCAAQSHNDGEYTPQSYIRANLPSYTFTVDRSLAHAGPRCRTSVAGTVTVPACVCQLATLCDSQADPVSK